MKALISPLELIFGGQRVAAVAADPFDVAPPLSWVDAPDDATPDTHFFNVSTGQVELNPPQPTASIVPSSVTRFQARAALFQAGYFDAVTEIMANPATPMLMRLAWQDALEFRRDSATVAALSATLGLSEAQVDALFISASQIEA